MENRIGNICLGQSLITLGECLSETNKPYESAIYGVLEVVSSTIGQYVYDNEGFATPESIDLQNITVEKYVDVACSFIRATTGKEISFNMLQLAFDTLREKVEEAKDSSNADCEHILEVLDFIEDEMILEKFLDC